MCLCVGGEGIGIRDGGQGESPAHGRIMQRDFDSGGRNTSPFEISIALRHKGRMIIGKVPNRWILSSVSDSYGVLQGNTRELTEEICRMCEECVYAHQKLGERENECVGQVIGERVCATGTPSLTC